MIKDFSGCHPSQKYYGGSGRKKGIRIDGENYIIKFRKNTKDGKAYNHVSEYLGSHIFELLGCVAQDTWLGMYQGEEIVLMKDFVAEEAVFVPFCDIREQALDICGGFPEPDCEETGNLFSGNEFPGNLFQKFEESKRLGEIRETFWDMFIIDALLGNSDRKENSWGFIERAGGYDLAPVFNNDACLFSGIISDEQCREILASDLKMEQLIFETRTSQIRMDREECSFFEIISSHRFRECDRAIWRIIKKMDFVMIDILVRTVDMLSDIKKQFVLTILEERYKRLLLEPFERTM